MQSTESDLMSNLEVGQSLDLLLTTPGESTKMSGVFVLESSNTDFISNTGGSTNLSETK